MGHRIIGTMYNLEFAVLIAILVSMVFSVLFFFVVDHMVSRKRICLVSPDTRTECFDSGRGQPLYPHLLHLFTYSHLSHITSIPYPERERRPMVIHT